MHPPDSRKHFRVRKLLWRLRQVGPYRLVRRTVRRLANPAWLASALFSLVGCMVSSTTSPTAVPTPSPTPDPPGWTSIAPGLEQRTYRPNGAVLFRLIAIRVDPAHYSFRAHYRPGAPLSLSGWQAELENASVILNANFFDRNNSITGLLFADSTAYGQSYTWRGGTFFVQNGQPGIRSNIAQPYQGEIYEQAVQAFPMLMTDGQQSYFDTRADRPSRRTVIAVDAQGKVVILVTNLGGITLLDLAEYLPTTDLNLVNALNLDGGGSTMLGVNDFTNIASFDPVPAVLGIYPQVNR